MIKKILIGSAFWAVTGLTGCVVVPRHGVFIAPAVIAPVPAVVVGPGYYGYGYGRGYGYGWRGPYWR
jgi:hypothetical protein